ncbi:MAG TPA: AmmeMemoRadiSam system radical SAM enzyme [Anaerolineae bacterium]|nr:AmmeMemoRadiSam system radical SAM enzyme [Anaerolineae bacterium]HIQ04732.1 AmmeMemoRadiSam system radical SAM enzyme [Anaerolineae bacterium]
MKGFEQSVPAQFIRPALLQEPAGRQIRCLICERRCEIIPGGLGWCRTRRHQDGTLVTLVYGAVSSLSANPIEKKPLYHFYPGTWALTSGSWSCNFGCPWCQNYDISKAAPGRGSYMSPEDFVLEAIHLGCQGTSISFNEPTLSLEWSLDVFRLARAQDLYNTYVTNGYMTPEALQSLVEAGLDAMNVDVKGDAEAVHRYCKGVDIEKVWHNCRLAHELGIHLEITTLVIPDVNDRDEVLQGIAERIVAELGPDVPWHVSRYYPAYRFTAPPTPVSTLEQAWQIGKRAGLEFVYLGNVLGHRLENTYCPGCGTLLIGRWGFNVTTYRLDHGHCSKCGREISGVWARPHASKGRSDSRFL